MNAFLDLADRQMAAPVQARQRAVEKRAACKATAEREQLSAAWRQWHGEQRDALLVGQFGDDVRRLIGFLDMMTFDQGAGLIELIKSGPWRAADANMRFQILRLIDSAIVTLRQRRGLPPFNDSLLHARPTVFQIIRDMLS